MGESNNINGAVPYAALENAQAQANVDKHRYFIIVIILIALLFGTNLGWIVYESKFTDEYIEVTQENESGFNSYIGRDGDIHNGETDNQNQETNP